MPPRIHLDDCQNTPYKELIQSLVRQWVDAPLPVSEPRIADYVRAISILLLTTQSPDQTITIVRAVLAQAVALHKTSAWVEQELKFEGMLSGVDRTDFLRLELQQADPVDDALLDSYNERMNRFSVIR